MSFLQSIMGAIFILLGIPLYANEYRDLSSFHSSSFGGILVNQFIVDYKTFYFSKGWPYLAAGLGVSGMLANTNIDQSIQNAWQDNLQNVSTDDLFREVDHYSALPQYAFFVPLYLLSTWLGAQYPNQEGTEFIGIWGDHSLRSFVLGAPQQAILTSLLGSGRPEIQDSKWHIFRHHRAVSGHAFYGSLPLINLAKTFENPFWKTATYFVSTWPALARVNNDKHYFSQAFLGWWLAFSSTQVVWSADHVSNFPYCVSWQLNPIEQGIYLSAKVNF